MEFVGLGASESGACLPSSSIFFGWGFPSRGTNLRDRERVSGPWRCVIQWLAAEMSIGNESHKAVDFHVNTDT